MWEVGGARYMCARFCQALSHLARTRPPSPTTTLLGYYVLQHFSSSEHSISSYLLKLSLKYRCNMDLRSTGGTFGHFRIGNIGVQFLISKLLRSTQHEEK